MELFKELLPYINIQNYITPVLGGFGITIGAVYLFGRMLNLIKSPYKKNLLAVFVAVLWTVVCEFELLSPKILSVVTSVSWLLVVYVLVGFNLYPWFTSFVETKVTKKKTTTQPLTASKEFSVSAKKTRQRNSPMLMRKNKTVKK